MDIRENLTELDIKKAKEERSRESKRRYPRESYRRSRWDISYEAEEKRRTREREKRARAFVREAVKRDFVPSEVTVIGKEDEDITIIDVIREQREENQDELKESSHFDKDPFGTWGGGADKPTPSREAEEEGAPDTVQRGKGRGLFEEVKDPQNIGELYERAEKSIAKAKRAIKVIDGLEDISVESTAETIERAKDDWNCMDDNTRYELLDVLGLDTLMSDQSWDELDTTAKDGLSGSYNDWSELLGGG